MHNTSGNAKRCDSLNDTIDFLDLVRIQNHGNAEFSEFFSEIIEWLATTNTECFLGALTNMDTPLQWRILEELRHPLFTETDLTDRIFRSYKNNEKYNSVIALYFNPTMPMML